MAIVSSSGEAQLEDRCALCHRHYTEPRLLQCLHSFDGKCISSNLCSVSSKSDAASRIRLATAKCPICAQSTELPTEGVSRLPVDWPALERLLKRAGEGELKLRCTVCADAAHRESEPATAACVDCAGYLCQSLYVQHAKLPAYKRHKLLSVQDVLAAASGTSEAQRRRDLLARQLALEDAIKEPFFNTLTKRRIQLEKLASNAQDTNFVINDLDTLVELQFEYYKDELEKHKNKILKELKEQYLHSWNKRQSIIASWKSRSEKIDELLQFSQSYMESVAFKHMDSDPGSGDMASIADSLKSKMQHLLTLEQHEGDLFSGLESMLDTLHKCELDHKFMSTLNLFTGMLVQGQFCFDLAKFTELLKQCFSFNVHTPAPAPPPLHAPAPLSTLPQGLVLGPNGGIIVSMATGPAPILVPAQVGRPRHPRAVAPAPPRFQSPGSYNVNSIRASSTSNLLPLPPPPPPIDIRFKSVRRLGPGPGPLLATPLTFSQSPSVGVNVIIPSINAQVNGASSSSSSRIGGSPEVFISLSPTEQQQHSRPRTQETSASSNMNISLNESSSRPNSVSSNVRPQRRQQSVLIVCDESPTTSEQDFTQTSKSVKDAIRTSVTNRYQGASALNGKTSEKRKLNRSGRANETGTESEGTRNQSGSESGDVSEPSGASCLQLNNVALGAGACGAANKELVREAATLLASKVALLRNSSDAGSGTFEHTCKVCGYSTHAVQQLQPIEYHIVTEHFVDKAEAPLDTKSKGSSHQLSVQFVQQLLVHAQSCFTRRTESASKSADTSQNHLTVPVLKCKLCQFEKSDRRFLILHALYEHADTFLLRDSLVRGFVQEYSASTEVQPLKLKKPDPDWQPQRKRARRSGIEEQLQVRTEQSEKRSSTGSAAASAPPNPVQMMIDELIIEARAVSQHYGKQWSFGKLTGYSCKYCKKSLGSDELESDLHIIEHFAQDQSTSVPEAIRASISARVKLLGAALKQASDYVECIRVSKTRNNYRCLLCDLMANERSRVLMHSVREHSDRIQITPDPALFAAILSPPHAPAGRASTSALSESTSCSNDTSPTYSKETAVPSGPPPARPPSRNGQVLREPNASSLVPAPSPIPDLIEQPRSPTLTLTCPPAVPLIDPLDRDTPFSPPLSVFPNSTMAPASPISAQLPPAANDLVVASLDSGQSDLESIMSKDAPPMGLLNDIELVGFQVGGGLDTPPDAGATLEALCSIPDPVLSLGDARSFDTASIDAIAPIPPSMESSFSKTLEATTSAQDLRASPEISSIKETVLIGEDLPPPDLSSIPRIHIADDASLNGNLNSDSPDQTALI